MHIHASEQAARQIMSPTERAHVVIVDQPCKRLKRGGIHKSSLRAAIDRARKENPQYADAAVVEIFFGTDQTRDTAIRFDPREPAIYGMH